MLQTWCRVLFRECVSSLACQEREAAKEPNEIFVERAHELIETSPENPMRVSNHSGTLVDFTASDVTAAQGDVRYLTLPQLLRIRCNHLEPSLVAVNSQFLDTIDEHVTKRLAERLVAGDGPAIQASQADEIVRLVILIYGANRWLTEQGTTTQCSYWLVRHGGLEALLHLPNCQLRPLQAVKNAARCHRSLFRLSAAVSRDKKKLHWEIHICEDPSSFDSSVPERKNASPRKRADIQRKGLPFNLSEKVQLSPQSNQSAALDISPSKEDSHDQATFSSNLSPDGWSPSEKYAPDDPPSSVGEAKIVEASVTLPTGCLVRETEGDGLPSAEPSAVAQDVGTSSITSLASHQENQEDWRAKYYELLQSHGELQAKLDQTVAEAARTAYALETAKARHAETLQSGEDLQVRLETANAQAARAASTLEAAEATKAQLHDQVRMLEGRIEELTAGDTNAGLDGQPASSTRSTQEPESSTETAAASWKSFGRVAAKATREAEERAANAIEEIAVLRVELDEAKADAAKGKLAEETIAQLRAELAKKSELCVQAHRPWLFCCNL